MARIISSPSLPGFWGQMATVQLLLIFITLSAAVSADTNFTVSGQLGGSVTIHCPYSKKADMWKQKIWCREVNVNDCEEIVRITNYYRPFVRRKSGNTSITDYIREHQVTVTMEGLRLEDAGVYRCQTENKGSIRTLRKVTVEVIGDDQEMPVAEESRTDDESRSAMAMTSQMLILFLMVILLAKILVVLGVYLLVRRYANWSRERAELL